MELLFSFLAFNLGFILLMIASISMIFVKAGQPGWASIIPIYNVYVLTCGVAKKELMWFILMLIPFVNSIAALFVFVAVAENFGKSAGFGLGLAFFTPIFLPILAFGRAEYLYRQRRRKDEDDAW
ncbi:MAG: DUF5684 domain-containing protein [Gemmataceae bacterium]|nr:DUF5684 domain-containing protein [Gemmata sp.]MDW8198230.1 DUF5684 domain-containing protein [Gemmataceae bacterium]